MSAQELAACAGHTDGDACTVDRTGGICTGGACVVAVCGDGVVEPGEVCDDGNRTSGDGCNGTCTSNETCGNGILDGAEECDCGNSTQPAAGCTAPNSADLSAECTLDCKRRGCGDGMVDTIEQCDGSVPDTVTCASYGYYRGDVTCVSCQFSVQGCSGRCGDGVIDTANGEYCDVAVPSDGSCVGFGYDLGPLACGIGCGADLSECHALAWEHVGSVTTAVQSLTSGGGRIGVAFGNGDAYVIDGGTWVKAPDTYSLVTGTATAVWAVGSDHVATWTAAGGWQAIPPPWPSGSPIGSIWASDALGLFVSRSDTVPLDHYQGTWTTVDGSWSAGARLLGTRTNLWLTSDGMNVQIFDGSTWSAISFGYIVAASEDDHGQIWAITDQGFIRGSPGAWQGVPAGGSWIAPGLGTMMIADIQGAAGRETDDMWVIGQPPLHLQNVPHAGPAQIAAAGTTIYAGAFDGVYELAQGMWEQNGTGGSPFTALSGGPGIEMYGGAAYGGAVELNEGDNFAPLDLPMDGCDSAGVTYGGSLLAACGFQHSDGTTTIAPGGGLFEQGNLVVPDFDATVLWAAPHSDDAAAAGPGVFAWRSQGVWQSTIVSYSFTTLAGDQVGELYAIDSHNMGLYSFDGTTWQLIAADAAEPLVVTPTRVYVGSSAGPLQITRTTTHVSSPAPFPPNASLFVGTGGEEVFVLASSLPRGSPLWHYDGQTLWPVRMPPGVGILESMGAVGRDLYVVQNPGSAVPPPIWWLERTSTW